ncbi:fumarylacetoacetate hydrolase, partial [Streptomyces sp. EL5]|nr:fumarylacetoacetate hydrolase [Streptomyces sp. EL5]
WVPGPLAGPSPVVLREDGVFDVSQRFATLSALFEEEAPLQALRDTPGRYLGSVEELLANSGEQADAHLLHLLPPADLQVIKAAGVTFAAS